MSKNTSHLIALEPRRPRGWSIVSNALTRGMIEEFVAAHPRDRSHGAIHDRDPGRAVHGHIFFYSTTQRTAAAMQRKFSVPVIVKPFIAHPGEPGADRGKFAMARGARYNTHEHPDQQALGKARYGDDEMIATPGWNWRAEVDALNAREGVDPGRPARLTLIERFSQRVLAGELTARDVHHQNKKIYLTKSQGYWNGLERQAAEWKRQDAEAAERSAHEERRHATDTEQAERERLAGEQAERERLAVVERETVERAEREAGARQLAEERAVREAELRAEKATPEYQERVATEQAESERVDLIDMIAMWEEVKGSRSARDSHATRYAAELGLTSSEHVREDGKLTHLGAVLAYAYAALDLEPDDADIDEIMPGIREEIMLHHQETSSAGRQLAGSEFHTADGDQQAFEKALSLRAMYSGYPDLITLPSPRSDIKKAWRDLLLAAS
ncbi:cell envelope integrity protein TolA [Paenarthrobacter sp. PH39-S1]|uniref:cell envelope integrity protein TolA n=1 Tax=Paenarthrobacter sp. PH39-S1 TaxID=3046204 RepID=UPI0024BABB5C|nr:cell envelope integrity protein TolA [Paenarthrobacter sp. PH39-S1]MDJ0356051.1 cell envelope integrity protein TolA [Paenarthrobacter sp. PH39-S1]